MATAPLRPCRHSGCSRLTREGYCEEHKPKYKRGASAAYHGLYSGREWKDKLRPEQLLREPFCRICAAQGIRTPATVVDHIRPHHGNMVLFRDVTNLQSLCKYHHDQKTIREQNGGA